MIYIAYRLNTGEVEVLAARLIKHGQIFSAAVALGSAAVGGGAVAADLPDYLEIVVDESRASDAEVAMQNTLALDAGMQVIYAEALAKYKQHLHERVPLILAMFSDGGGRFVLYQPGRGRIEAPPVPEIYPLAKSVSHSTMAVYQLVAPYLLDPSDGSWRQPMLSYRGQIQATLGTLDDLDVDDEVRARFRTILEKDIAFMDECLQTGQFSLESVTAFAREVEPLIHENVWLAASAQVKHWQSVLTEWKAMLGDQWQHTYAVSNTIYVTRRNNILFSVLAQFMGADAINHRLLLVETTSFESPEADLLDVVTRIIADRAIGEIFFRAPQVMDAELLGEAAREAIEADATTDRPAVLPSVAPYNTVQWPWQTETDSGSGPGNLKQLGD